MLIGNEYKGKTVLVVGGTGGIGNGIARRFRDQGAAIYIWGTQNKIEDYKDDRCDYTGMHYSQVDVSDPANIERYHPPFKTLDVLVLSQGIILQEEEYKMDIFSKVLDINLVSIMACCLKFKDMLATSKGSIIMISSMASVMATSFTPAYAASKYGVNGLCKVLARRWAGEGLRVNAIAAGMFPSRMSDVVANDPGYLQLVLSKTPMGRFGKVEEMGDACLFLASSMASFITGNILMVDGGYTLQDLV
jgi:3-oxoacyl-[acyl-carrier protein] reductase